MPNQGKSQIELKLDSTMVFKAINAIDKIAKHNPHLVTLLSVAIAELMCTWIRQCAQPEDNIETFIAEAHMMAKDAAKSYLTAYLQER